MNELRPAHSGLAVLTLPTAFELYPGDLGLAQEYQFGRANGLLLRAIHLEG